MDNCKGQVLVVEDNSTLAAVIRFNLERAGLQVTVAQNGREAWDCLERQPFDVVLTDEQMPEVSGRELCKRMRGQAEHALKPVIMLTAKAFELDRRQLREELGIKAVFVKPFSPREVVEKVQELLAAGS